MSTKELSLVDDFQEWIGLNPHTVSWEGRDLKKFDAFWSYIFNGDTDQCFKRLNELFDFVSSGPLKKWTIWLRDHFVIYSFVKLGYPINSIIEYSKIDQPNILNIFREFFLYNFPKLTSQINDLFLHQGMKLSSQNKTSYQDIIKGLEIGDTINNRSLICEKTIIADLEITLLDEWFNFYEQRVEHQLSVGYSSNFFKSLKILTIFTLVVTSSVYFVKFVNQKYENHLVKKIQLFEPNFFWLNKNIGIGVNSTRENNLNYQLGELEELEKEEQLEILNPTKASRYEVESEISVTSLENSRDIENAAFENSIYEERLKGGYKQRSYFKKKAYRIVYTPENFNLSNEELQKYIKKNDIEKVDQVEPGTIIPGGALFHVYLDPDQILEIKNLIALKGAFQIIETKTNYDSPKGKNRVFVWLKKN